MAKRGFVASPEAAGAQTVAPPLRLVFLTFLRIGAMSVGGGSLAWIHREIVIRRRWMTNDEFMAGIALAQVLPGVNTTNASVYVGHRLGGLIGAGIALGGFLLGPFCFALIAAAFYLRVAHAPGFAAAMIGVAAVALGMVLRVALLSARNCATSIVSWALMIAAFVGVGILRLPLAPVVLILAAVGIWAHRRPGSREEAREDA